MARTGYDDVVLAVPVTIPYVRYSIRSAHWFLGRAMAELIAGAKIPKARIDGLAVASFTLAPDTAVGLTQHLGLTLRWLDHVPMGGASGIVSIRRAARAVQSGDAEIVACIAGDTNHTDSFRRNTASLQPVCPGCGLSVRLRRPEHELRVSDSVLHAHLRGAARGFRQALRRAAQQRAAKPAGTVQEAADARSISQRAPDRRSAAVIRLRDAMRRRRGFFGNATPDCRGSWAALCAPSRRDRTAQRLSRRSDPISRRLGARPR